MPPTKMKSGSILNNFTMIFTRNRKLGDLEWMGCCRCKNSSLFRVTMRGKGSTGLKKHEQGQSTKSGWVYHYFLPKLLECGNRGLNQLLHWFPWQRNGWKKSKSFLCGFDTKKSGRTLGPLALWEYLQNFGQSTIK